MSASLGALGSDHGTGEETGTSLGELSYNHGARTGMGMPPGKLGSGHGAGELSPEEGVHGHDNGGLWPWG